jgi:hypothetical protein
MDAAREPDARVRGKSAIGNKPFKKRQVTAGGFPGKT